MKFKFDISRGDFQRAVVWVYDRTDGLNQFTRFNAETNDRTGTISWNDPWGEYKARIIVYYTLDVVPPTGQDVWINNLPCSEPGIFEETVVIHSVKAGDGYQKSISATTTGGSLSNWMKDDGALLGSRQLRNLILPGTHDSGSFDPQLGGAAQTQDLSLGDQLKYGVRVFDFRVTRIRNAKDGLVAGQDYLDHNGYTRPIMNLELAAIDILTFAASHPRELIILNLRTEGWCNDPNPLLPTADNRFTGFTNAEERAFRDKLVGYFRATHGSLVYDHATYGSADTRPLGRRTLNEILNTGKNVIIIGNDPFTTGKVYWPSSSNYKSTWDYVSWISSAGKTLDQRMYGAKVAISEKTDGIPLDPVTDGKLWTAGDGVAPGFVPTYEALHRRRLGAKGTGHWFEEVLIDFGPNFATLDIVSAATVVGKQSIEWMEGWEAGALKGALNVAQLDFFTRVPFVPRVIKLNRARS